MSERAKNRLAREASPYLQQHAHNPVDWFPWGEEALTKAKTQDKPILLSIGYSACHWCHVMERESFEDADIARQMNDDFVSIKVDREERPDLDHIYQMVVQLMGRSGGWPLTVFLTPEQKPFFAGTYFPPRDRYGISGFPSVLTAIADLYKTRRGDVEKSAQEISHALSRVGESKTPDAGAARLGPDLLERVGGKLLGRFDPRFGGFGGRPKFPNTMCLDVLLRRGVEERHEQAAESVRRALTRMRAGGIWDHLGGGFHRYSTDERWLVPHFEKMLYDNALLLRLYTDAFRAFGRNAYAATARDIGAYLLGEMESPGGGFFASQDADSEGEEGKFFVWTEDQMRSALAGDEMAARAALRYYGVTAAGNFESTGATVLHENRPLTAVATELGLPLADVEQALARARTKLRAAREKREKTFRDEKILASWNGLVIGALADAASPLGEPSFLAAAVRAYDRVERDLSSERGVERLVKDGVVRGPGFLDDYAFLASAALDLYEATGHHRYVGAATRLADQLLTRFWDDAGGGFFFTPNDGEKLITRSKDPFDQAVPSGGSIAALVLLRLAATTDEKYGEPARRYLADVAPSALDNPFAFGQTIGVLDRLVRGSTDVVILGALTDPRAKALHGAALARYLPNRNVVWADPTNTASLAAAPLLTRDKTSERGAVAFVCRGRTCSAPVSDPDELRALFGAT
ncbi:MAG TPA: thioredoxin domain-containing protein [Polyangiaceae bacterium]|nr:thioredoxin domain-containing protein [Polyangiaceae bacterium]